jgi:hypothetical protein
LRVVFVSHADTRLPGLPKPIGKGKTGLWLAMDDDALLAAWGLGAKLDLLFLSHVAYLHAVRGLDEKQTAEAVETRHQRVSPVALDRAVGWLGTRARRALALAAAKAPVHVERILAQLVALETEGRFAMLTPRERLLGLAEGEAGLVAELRDLRPDRTEELAAREEMYVAHARELEPLGMKGLAEAPLHVGLTRVFAISPAGESQSFFRDREEPQTLWRDQPVGPVKVRDVARWGETGKTLTLLLPSRGALFGLLDLTVAQRDVELDERAKEPGLEAHLAQLRVELAIRKRALVTQLPAGAAAMLRRQIPKDGELVVAALAESPSEGKLLDEERGRAADAKFLAAWARLAGRLELSLELAAHAELVLADAKGL